MSAVSDAKATVPAAFVRKRSTFHAGGNPHAFVSRGILVALFNGNVETARARDAHLRGLISNPDRAKANGTLPACLVFREERKG